MLRKFQVMEVETLRQEATSLHQTGAVFTRCYAYFGESMQWQGVATPD